MFLALFLIVPPLRLRDKNNPATDGSLTEVWDYAPPYLPGKLGSGIRRAHEIQPVWRGIFDEGLAVFGGQRLFQILRRPFAAAHGSQRADH